jgi:hypothetical protein
LERPSLEYLAGFFDGEGNIGIYSGGGTGRTLRAQVTQADSEIARALLGYFKESWGGSVCRFNRALRRNAWNFQVGGDGARSLISDLRPHLILKAAQADLALLWFEARPQLTRTPDGRMAARTADDRALADRVADLLHRMKLDQVTADAADLVEVRHTLRQILNVRGD